MRYRFNWDYRAGAIGYQHGDEIEFDDAAVVAHLLRDSPGCMSPVEAAAEAEVTSAAVETRDLTEPPEDRMIKRPPARRGR